MLMSGKAKEGLVTYPVIKELDQLKLADGLKGKQARDAIHNIHKNPRELEIIYVETESAESVDDFLIRYAKRNDLILQTLDLSLHLKAQAMECASEFAYNGSTDYTGATYLNDDEFASVLDGSYNKIHPINHFLIYGKQAFIKTRDGLREINYYNFSNRQVGAIKPRNIEQYCLTELLIDEIPIISATGGFGTGKSWCLLNYAIKQLEEEKINKIIIIPNNAATSDSMEVGTLPGDIFDKLGMFSNVLLDLMSIHQIEGLMAQEKLEIIPIAMLRGRNLEKSILWASESQNLSSYHMKLILGRAGQGTRLFADGDYRQADKKIFEQKSGIKLLSRLSETQYAYLFGTIELQQVERSIVSQMAAVLDEM